LSDIGLYEDGRFAISSNGEVAGIQGSMRSSGLREVLDCGRKLLATFDEKHVSRSKNATYHVKLRRVERLAIEEGRLQRFSYTPPDPI
jgi:hypothetical protein